MPRKHIAEQVLVFLSIVKWLILATGIGILVGLSTALFLKTLEWGIALTSRHPYYFLLLPLALVASVLLVKYLAPDAEGHGTEKVIEAIHKQAGKIKAAVVPVKLAATVITISFGGSAGKEGPASQIGAGLASTVSDLLRLNDIERRKLVICGISAGFASVFGTPIAGAIFGVEVLFAGRLLYDVLLPSFIAGLVSFQMTSSLGIRYYYHTINFVPVFSRTFFAEVLLAGATNTPIASSGDRALRPPDSALRGDSVRGKLFHDRPPEHLSFPGIRSEEIADDRFRCRPRNQGDRNADVRGQQDGAFHQEALPPAGEVTGRGRSSKAGSDPGPGSIHI